MKTALAVLALAAAACATAPATTTSFTPPTEVSVRAPRARTAANYQASPADVKHTGSGGSAK